MVAEDARDTPDTRPARLGERAVLVARVDQVLASATPWPYHRPLQVEDIPWLALAVWEEVSPGPTDRDWDATVTFTQEVLKGARGEFVPLASPVAVNEDGSVAGAIATVLAPGSGGEPARPTVMVGLTLPEHRHHGVATGMLAAAAQGLRAIGHSEIAIAFDGTDPGIRSLATRLGFARAEDARSR